MITTTQQQYFIQQYQNGISLSKIAKEVGCSPRTVQQHLEKCGIARRTISQANRRYTVIDSAFDDINNEDTQYWVGFLLADGCVHEYNQIPSEITVELQEADINHLHKLQHFVGTTKPIYHLTRTKGVRLEISSRQIASDLGNLNIIPRKSKIATVPPVLSTSRHFWRGLIDGDGGLRITSKEAASVYLCGTYNVVSEFAKYVQQILQIPTKAIPYRMADNLYTIAYNNTVAIKIIHRLYTSCVTYLNRKYDVYTQLLNIVENKQIEQLNRINKQKWIEVKNWCRS